MTRLFLYFLLGLFLILLQTSVFPRFLPYELKPDLLLILVVYLGLNEKCLPGGIAVYLLGCLVDTFAGYYPGLYGLAFLVVFFAVRGASGRLNTESSLLFYFLVFCGTFVEAGILSFSLSFFAEAGSVFPLFARYIIPQSLLNLAAAVVMLILATHVQRYFSPRLEIPGMRHIS